MSGPPELEEKSRLTRVFNAHFVRAQHSSWCHYYAPLSPWHESLPPSRYPTHMTASLNCFCSSISFPCLRYRSLQISLFRTGNWTCCNTSDGLPPSVVRPQPATNKLLFSKFSLRLSGDSGKQIGTTRPETPNQKIMNSSGTKFSMRSFFFFSFLTR